ncbi:MAG TPA: hypothetical protein DHW82_08015 [Spirochaetia bacterium]|nr:MAG: hypothetical protein A2Y41_06645 [Spirochaetes bacterium GWB1_36_13]HCL56938.1 hypothetical protein [Spirochaetia bacterium]
MIQIDKNFALKKFFQNSVKITIYRSSINEEAKKLKSFFEDYFEIILTDKIEEINSTDILNIEQESDESIQGLSYRYLWIENNQELFLADHTKGYGSMKKFYISNFLDSCSA